MIELWLIRHGISTANVEGLVTGHAHASLTDKGRRQAIQMGQWLSEYWRLSPDIYVTSSMGRAIETAELLNLQGLPVQCPEFNEADAGEVSSWKRKVFDNTYPDFWEPFDENRPFPGGESHQDLYERVTTQLNGIMSEVQADSKILLVAHAGTISSIFHSAYQVPMKFFSRFVVDNGSLSILKYSDLSDPPELVLYNQVPPGDLNGVRG